MKGAAMAINEGRDYQAPQRNGKLLNKLGLWAAIVVGLPTLFAAGQGFYQIVGLPAQVNAQAKRQDEMDKRMTAYEASQKDIRDGINRILSAMRLEPIKEPKPRETQP